MNVSKTYDILDCIFYDEAVTSRNANWSNGYALSVVTEDGCTKLSSTTSNSTGGTSKINVSLTGDFEIDLQANIPVYNNNVGLYMGVKTSSNEQSMIRLTQTGWRDIRFKRVNGVYSCEMKELDSSTWTTTSLLYDNAGTGAVNGILQIYNQSGTKYELDYKNLKIYPIS